ncbi:hypothetical protein ACFQ9J_13605 [Streptomyces sp. NPDC056529]|uniref:hypothetical protein n=1 Tax=Streptomyces sp. NPDC056529 TaxID=3345855 RepID=UPI0036B80CF2
MTTPPPEGTPPTAVPPSGEQQRSPDDRDALLTGHAALVFLGAVLIGLVFGALCYLRTGEIAEGLIGGLSAAGVSLLALHKLIGP